MSSGKRSLPLVALAALCVLAAVGCGPNTFTVRGKVLHPMHEFREGLDDEAGRPPRKLVKVRKETRVSAPHRIVGAYAKPPAMLPFSEVAQMVSWADDGSMMRIQFRVCSNYKDEMDLRKKWSFTLKNSEGAVFKGEVTNQWPIENYTVKVSGMHMETHLVVKDGRQVKAYRHPEEVTNEFEKYCREARIEFRGAGIFTKASTYLVFTADGYQRRWRFWYDFTWDPAEAMQTAAETEDSPF